MQQQKKKQQINKYEIMLDSPSAGPGPVFTISMLRANKKLLFSRNFGFFAGPGPVLYSAYIALYNHYIISVVFNEGQRNLPMPQALLAYYSTEKII